MLSYLSGPLQASHVLVVTQYIALTHCLRGSLRKLIGPCNWFLCSAENLVHNLLLVSSFFLHMRLTYWVNSIIVLTDNLDRNSPCTYISCCLFLLAETNFKSSLVRIKNIDDLHPTLKILFTYKALSLTL